MPRLPFMLKMPKGAKSSTKVVADVPLHYDSTRVYMQLGSALRASETAQTALLRISQLIVETEGTKELQEAALLERLTNIVSEIDAFERLLVKFESTESQKIARLIINAFENVRSASGWFLKFLENHSEEDVQAYRPLATRLQAIVNELVDARKQKIENAIAAEDAYNDKKHNVQKRANATRPVVRRNLPYPAEPTPSVALSPEESLQALRKTIIKKERGTTKKFQLEE